MTRCIHCVRNLPRSAAVMGAWLARRFLWLAVWADPMTVTRFVLMAEGETKKRYQLVSHPTNESPTRG